jgi:hypothetical protein
MLYRNRCFRKALNTTTTILLILLVVGCSGTKDFRKSEPIPDDRNSINQIPKSRGSVDDFQDAIDKQFAVPIENLFDLPRQASHITGNRTEAFNVNSFDEVPNSAWYTHRNGSEKMSLDEIFTGPNSCVGPDTSTTWTIIRAKADGVTPGFAIEDSNGDKYFIKFDPTRYSELASGAEVVATKLFYAAGYFTPENFITYFDPEKLKMGDKVKFTDHKGRKRFMTEDDLNEIIESVEIGENGRIRAIASKYVPGRPLGPFRYESTVKSDPNDFIPHQHRRELRGLYVLGAWLNHIDSKGQNSLDTYIEDENGNKYVRHYLIDFGTCLGSGGRGPHPLYRGHENEIDPGSMLRKILTLGLWVKDYEKPDIIEFPSIGRYSSTGFEPGRFQSIFPNPAYANMTLRDAFWGTKLVMSFDNDQLAKAVESGKYSNETAADYLLEQLILRRDAIGKYWFDRISPLDDFELKEESDGTKLLFKDIAIATGLETTSLGYVVEMEIDGVLASFEVKKSAATPDGYFFASIGDLDFNDIATLKVGKKESGNKIDKYVHIYISRSNETGGLEIVGIYRTS